MKSFVTLRWQLILLILVLVLAMIVGAGFFLTRQAQDALISEKNEKIAGLTQQMAFYFNQVMDRLSSDPQYQTGESKERRKMLETELSKFTEIIAQSYPNVFYFYLVSEFGAPLASRPQPGLNWFSISRQYTDLVRNGEVVGQAYAMEDQALIDAQLAQIRNVSLVIMGVVFLIGTLGAVFIGTNLSRGVVRIKNGLNQVERDLSYRLPALSGEMGEIARAVNRLASALEEAKDYTRYVLDNIGTGIVSLDEEGNITVFNPAAEKLLGIKSAEALGQPFQKILIRARVPQAGKMVQLLKEHQGDEQAIVISSSSGEPVELGLTALTLVTSSGRTAGKVLTIEDLSLKRKLEELIRRSDRLSALGLFTTGIAHEVRNPLASIKGFAQLLLSRKLVSKSGQKYVETIVRETERLDGLLAELLSFARPSPPQLGLRSLGPIIERTLVLIEERAREQGVEIKKELNDTPLVLIDEQKMQQVFWNIFINALQAMPKGGVLIIRLETQGEEVVAAITDSGPGIPAAHWDKIFDPFFTTKDWGSGLGLAISHRIVETLGGRIEFTSDQSKGTTFWVFLPAVKVES